MANMSYCRFNNTLSDLKDCYQAINDDCFDDLSDSERDSYERLLLLCHRIAENCSNEIEEIKERRQAELNRRMEANGRGSK